HGALCEMLSLCLIRYGYDVRTADNGETALEILRDEEIHLVLLDLMLPRLDGSQFSKSYARTERVVPRISSSSLPELRKEIATNFSSWEPMNTCPSHFTSHASWSAFRLWKRISFKSVKDSSFQVRN